MGDGDVGRRSIPTVDLSPFFLGNDGDNERTEAARIIGDACRSLGFFRVINHGVPSDLMARALDLSKEFFCSSDEEKAAASPAPGSGSPLPAGYAKQPDHSPDKNEYILLFPPHLGFNVYPSNPPEFRGVMEECFGHLTKAAQLVEDILNDCNGLPPNTLRDYNNDRNSDFMAVLRYFPATEAEVDDNNNNGLTPHEDGNIATFVFEDGVGGLEVLSGDFEWVPVEPVEGSLVVNVGDILQVLSNGVVKSATHRVVRKTGTHRHSFAFFFSVDAERWIEPLPQFAAEAGRAPRYRRFLFGEYLQLRMRNKTHPPDNPDDVVHITHYAIPDA